MSVVVSDENKDSELQLVVFELGTEEFGVDISQVREIIKSAEITKMPNTPDFVNGVINLRGSITTVMDLRKKLGIQSKSSKKAEDEGIQEVHDRDIRIIIVELENNTIGMMVDAVSEVLRMSVSDVDSESIATSQIGEEYIRGVGKLEDRILILLDLNKVISRHDVAQIERAEDAAEKTAATS